MRTIILVFLVCIFNSAFSQITPVKKATVQSVITIKVPDFNLPDVKTFYTDYANHLIKCVQAIRQNDETKVIALFKNPGEKLVAREKILSAEVIKDPIEKEKYMQFAAQVYPYIKEVERSSYYQKTYVKKG